MYKQVLFVIFVLFSTIISAQNVDSKYLKGAVPEVEGKVVFSKVMIPNSDISEDEMFLLFSEWAHENYREDDKLRNRVTLEDALKKEIACLGEKEITFTNTTFVLDRTWMSYILTMKINDGKYDITIKNIKFKYNESNQEGKYKYLPAEEMIADKYALNGKGTQIRGYYKKFRTHCIDEIDNISNSIETYINKGQPEPLNVVIPHKNVPIRNENGSLLPLGYKQITPDKIPGNIINLFNSGNLITSGEGKDIMMGASWGGLGVIGELPVAFSFIHLTHYSIETMDDLDYYTISFYTEAHRDALNYCSQNSGRETNKIKGSGLTPIRTPSGSIAFSEAWMILECKKILAQPITSDAVLEDFSGNRGKDGYHKMYVGRILNVWIK